MSYTLEYSDGYYIAKDGDGVIDFVNSEDIEFAQLVLSRLNKNPKFLSALREVILYLWVDEERDWDLNGKPKNHIFNDLKVLKNHLEQQEKMK